MASKPVDLRQGLTLQACLQVQARIVTPSLNSQWINGKMVYSYARPWSRVVDRKTYIGDIK